MIAFDPWSLVIAVVIYIVLSMMSCNEQESKLAMKEGAGLCHTIGDWCSSMVPRVRPAPSTPPAKCCFNSMLARIVNEQGRSQVAKGWGAAQSPDCSGFTVPQLQSLNFAAMDLSEFYASLVPTLPNVADLQGQGSAKAADLLLRTGEMPMKCHLVAACLVGAMLMLPRTARPSPSQRCPPRRSASLMVAAIDAPDGQARGILAGPLADAVRAKFNASGPIHVEVSTLKALRPAGLQPPERALPAGRRSAARIDGAARSDRRFRHQLLPRWIGTRLDEVIDDAATYPNPLACRAWPARWRLPRHGRRAQPTPTGAMPGAAGTSTRNRQTNKTLPHSAPKAAPIPAKPTRAPELVEFEQLQKSLEERRQVAIIRPSEANVRRYMELEAQVVAQASRFADVAQRVAWSSPELDPSLQGRPVNAKALEVFDQQQLADRSRSMQDLARDHVLIFVFRSDCPYCHAFAPTLDAFRRRHGLQVLAVTLDGGTLPGFADARRDNGIAANLRVTQVPAVFLAQPFTGQITPVGFGVMSEAAVAGADFDRCHDADRQRWVSSRHPRQLVIKGPPPMRTRP